MKVAPKWAQDLTLNALIHLTKEGFNPPVPSLSWRRAKHPDSTGACYPESEQIHINAGRSRTDTKMVLLHELAHLVTEGIHSPQFWDVAWMLYRWAKLPVRYCLAREKEYRKGAVTAYIRSRKS